MAVIKSGSSAVQADVDEVTKALKVKVVDAVTLGTVEVTNDAGAPIPVNGTVEVTNDAGNPLPVSGPLTDAQLRAAPVPISDGGGSVTVDGTVDLSTTSLAALETINAGLQVGGSNVGGGNPVPVSGSVTISDGSGPVTVDGSVSVAGSVEVTNDAGNPLPVSGSVEVSNDAGNPLPISGTVAVSNPPAIPAAVLAVTGTAAAAAGVTVTLPAAGPGLFHYITSIELTLHAAAAGTAAATPVVVTSTNLPGNSAWSMASAAAAVGAIVDRLMPPLEAPLKSAAANTPTTIVCPATASRIWRVNVMYYTAA